MILKWVLPVRVRDELAALSEKSGRPKSRLIEDVWARQRPNVAALTAAACVEVHEMREAGAPLQAAREMAALAGGSFPVGACEEVLYCRDAFLEQVEREAERLGVDEAALLLFCWQREKVAAISGRGYSWESAVTRRLGPSW